MHEPAAYSLNRDARIAQLSGMGVPELWMSMSKSAYYEAGIALTQQTRLILVTGSDLRVLTCPDDLGVCCIGDSSTSLEPGTFTLA